MNHITYVDGSESLTLDRAINFLKETSIISLDTETTGFDPYLNHLLLISMGNRRNSFVFDVARMGNKINRLLEILRREDKLFIIQNAKFDYKFIKKVYDVSIPKIYDTMLAEMLIMNGRRKSGFSLEDLVRKYTDAKVNKDVRATFGKMSYGDEFTLSQIQYSGEDVLHLETIFSKQSEVLKRDGLTEAAKVENYAIAPTAEMELNGIYINQQAWMSLEGYARDQLEIAVKKLDEHFNEVISDTNLFDNLNINYNSPVQLKKALSKLLGREIESTAEAELKKIDHPVIDSILEYREHAKRISTYGLKFLQDHVHPITDRIHPTFNQLGAETGRYSSSDPNAQNIPRDNRYRHCFQAQHPDYRILTADYGQFELGILAELSGEPEYVRIFEQGLDAHAHVASILFGKTIRKAGTLGPDDLGENAELRDYAKTVNFLVNYGGGPTKLAAKTGLSFNSAKEILKRYWETFPLNRKFFDERFEQAKKEQCLINPFDGRRRWALHVDMDAPNELWGLRNESFNFPMQSGNATMMKTALSNCLRALRSYDAKLLITVHDEIVVEMHKDIAEEVRDKTIEAMNSATQKYMSRVPISVDAHIDKYWTK